VRYRASFKEMPPGEWPNMTKDDTEKRPVQRETLTYLIFRTARILNDRMLTGRQDFIASMTLAHAFAMRYISEYPELTNTELARRLKVSKQATSQLVANLESLGFVSRSAHPSDGRAQVLSLTEVGNAFLEEDHRRATEIEREWVDVLGPRRASVMREALESVVTAEETPETLLQLPPSMLRPRTRSHRRQ
jgi:DNA-binding MarR family transcriptional regulator